MNNFNLNKNVQFYCNVRIVSNIVLAVVLATIAIYISSKINYTIKNKNKYTETTAKIISIDLYKDNFIYYPVYKISFNESQTNKEITTFVYNITQVFQDKESGENFIAHQAFQKELNIFYSKTNPEKDIVIKGQEKFISSTFSILAISLLAFALLSYILIGNPIYCGFVIFRDIFTIFT